MSTELNKLKSVAEEAVNPYRDRLPIDYKLPDIAWNLKLKKTAGRLRRYKQTDVTEIQLSFDYLNHFGYENVRKTLLHELAHELDWRLNKNSGHTDSFKKLCQALGGHMNHGHGKGEFADCATKEFIPRDKMLKRYIYSCPCGKEFKRVRKIKVHPISKKIPYACKSCSGTLFLKETL